MRISTKILALAILGGAIAIAPTTGALDFAGQCIETTEVTTLPGGSASLVTPPGADVLGWTPECVMIQAGATLTWTQRDGIGHGVISDATGCINLPNMSVVTLPTTSVKLELTELTNSDGDVIGLALAGTESDGGVGVCDIPAGATEVVIPYHCRVHGSQMPGKIVVVL